MDTSAIHFRVLKHFTSFKEAISYANMLINCRMDFSKERQPEAWIQRIINYNEWDTVEVVQFIVSAFGSYNPICEELSMLYETEVHLIDALYIFSNECYETGLIDDTMFYCRIVRLITQLEMSVLTSKTHSNAC